MKRTVKTNIAVFITMFAVLACATYLFAQSVASPDLMYFPDPSAKVSMDFKDASLRDILKSFSILSGLNFVATENVQERKVTLYLDNVPVRDALDKIFKANNLAYELEPESNIFIVKDLGKPEIDLISRTYYLKYIQVPKTNMMKESGSAGSGIGEVLTNILSENGKMAEDPRTNSIVITDVATRFPMIEQTIMSLDVPQPQVLIEVEIVDTTKNIVDEMGFTWSGNFLSFQAATVPHGTKFPFGSLIPDISKARRQSANGSAWLTDGKFDTSGITATLKLLSTITDTKYLARPRILTINNETAEIKITTEEVIGQKTTTSAAEGGLSTETAEAERAETGISLKVTPNANLLTKEVTMYLEPVVKEATLSAIVIKTTAGDQTVKDLEERSTKATLKVKDGDTIVMGGMIRHTESKVITKIPFLGDIPFFGLMFRNKKDEPKDRELLVFITPHIIMDASTTEFAAAPKGAYPILPVREQQATYIKRFDAVDQALRKYELR